MALRVGLTGGIASGKSSVAQRFAALGVPIIDADEVGRELVAPGSALLQTILERFGPTTLQRYGKPLSRNDGALDRALLRRLVFEDAGQRRALEALLHPQISTEIEARAAAVSGPYQLHVVPLLVESHAQERYDRVLVVDCPAAQQLKRLRERDGIDERQARAMLEAQAPRELRLAAADDVIVNDAAPDDLAPQVQALDQKYRALAASAGA